MTIRFTALSTVDVEALRAGASDSNGQVAERQICQGAGNPCRHCLHDIDDGKEMLVFGHRPFDSIQPYAECGPIFVCADACERQAESNQLPPVIASRPRFIVRGYTGDERISYGTGAVVETSDIVETCERHFVDPEIAFVHVRSVQNNCFFCRVDRG